MFLWDYVICYIFHSQQVHCDPNICFIWWSIASEFADRVHVLLAMNHWLKWIIGGGGGVQNHWNLFWVYQNGIFLPGQNHFTRGKNQEKWLCLRPLWKIFLLRRCIRQWSVMSTIRSIGSRFTSFEPLSNRSQYKTNGTLVHNYSVIQLLLRSDATKVYSAEKKQKVWYFHYVGMGPRIKNGH